MPWRARDPSERRTRLRVRRRRRGWREVRERLALGRGAAAAAVLHTGCEKTRDVPPLRARCLRCATWVQSRAVARFRKAMTAAPMQAVGAQRCERIFAASSRAPARRSRARRSRATAGETLTHRSRGVERSWRAAVRGTSCAGQARNGTRSAREYSLANRGYPHSAPVQLATDRKTDARVSSFGRVRASGRHGGVNKAAPGRAPDRREAQPPARLLAAALRAVNRHSTKVRTKCGCAQAACKPWSGLRAQAQAAGRRRRAHS